MTAALSFDTEYIDEEAGQREGIEGISERRAGFRLE